MAHASASTSSTDKSDATQPSLNPTANQSQNQPNEPAEPGKIPAAEFTDSGADGARRLREHLQNWQVLDPVDPDDTTSESSTLETSTFDAIEGEATVLSESAVNAARAIAGAGDPEDPDLDAQVDVVDSILIAGLPERTVTVKPGSASQLVVSLLNNGSQPVTFDVHVEGWVRDGWLPEGTHHIAMQPGERNALRITFAPPHSPDSLAGEFPLVIVVRSQQYRRRVTRLHARLIIRPFTDFALGKLEDRQLRRTRSAQSIFTLPVTNESNHPISVQVQAQTIGLDTESGWLDPKVFSFGNMERGKHGDGWLPNPTVLPLKTGETREVALRIKPRKAPLFGGRAIDASVRVTASVVGEVRMPRSATAEMEYTPPVKPWHLALAAAASMLLLVITGIAALGTTLFLNSSARTAAGTNAPIVIVLNQNAPTSAVQGVAQGVFPTVGGSDTGTAQGGPVAESAPGNVPVVTADQITNPGESGAGAATLQEAQEMNQGAGIAAQEIPVAQAPSGTAPLISAADISTPPQGGIQRPQAEAPQPQNRVASAPPTDASTLTYGQMFQEIALEFDLDWRLLAAQAYVETGLDALALGNDGDMGLMQVLPGTWREFAPKVGAADPFDAYSNTLVASAYLDYVRGELGKRGYPQAQWMLVAYNWGPDRLINFLEEGGVWEGLPAVRQQYATDIIKIARTIP